jgi:hypothetical protein
MVSQLFACARKNPIGSEKLRYWDFTVPILGRPLPRKFQIPNPKLQTRFKSQNPSKTPRRELWKFGALDFLGIWNLGFGISLLRQPK